MVRKQAFHASVLLGALLSGAAARAAVPGTFERVGDLTAPRGFATVTLLRDRTVLVAGGLKSDGPVGAEIVSQAAAERFDPLTNTFSAVGSMAYPRARHAAAHLQDGRVLVVGGSNDRFPATDPNFTPGEMAATAELFDPATGLFTPTGDLITPRISATATRLPNGKVLVVGGKTSSNATVETAELFDPATGKFIEAGPMTLGRSHHAAVALPDGRVAILGGVTPDNRPRRSIEIYNPDTNTFSPTGQMAEARANFEALLVPGARIVVAGGTGPHDPSLGFFSVLNSVEIYDPATGQSTVTDHMPDTRFNHTAVTLANGRVLVIGGQHSNDVTDPNIRLSSAVLIDQVTGKVTPTGYMSTGRQNGPRAVLLADGRVLVLGGKLANTTAEVYTP